MKRTGAVAAIAVLVAAGALGCGDSDDSTEVAQTTTEELTPAEQANEAAIEQAEQTASTRSELEADVLKKLNAEFDIATCPANQFCSYGVPEGKERPIRIGDDIEINKSLCFVDSIFVGPDAGFTNEYVPLYAPDGSGGIVIGMYEDAEEADCLNGFAQALEWG